MLRKLSGSCDFVCIHLILDNLHTGMYIIIVVTNLHIFRILIFDRLKPSGCYIY